MIFFFGLGSHGIRITIKYASIWENIFASLFSIILNESKFFGTLPSSHDGTVDDSETSGEYNQIGLVVYLVTV